jgi:hypothetical protein
VLAKYYKPKNGPSTDSKALASLKDQRAFEKGLWDKTKKPGGEYKFDSTYHQLPLTMSSPMTDHYDNKGDIILYDSYLAVYKHSLDLIFYILGPSTENELMLHAALTAFFDAASLLLRNQIEKRSVLENLDLILLCLDETIDDG